jgi:hypothetical protein
VDGVEGGTLRGVLGDYPFSAVGVGDGVGGAEGVELVFAFQAQGGFEGCGAVVETGVYDLELS